MHARESKRSLSWAASVLAIVTMACLLTAPFCAPLCAASMCTPAGHGHCHEAAGNDADHAAFAPTKLCGRFELSAVLASDDQQLWSTQRLRHMPSTFVTGMSLRNISCNKDIPKPERRSAQRVPVENSEALLASTILQI
jgi:hypothetical protein